MAGPRPRNRLPGLTPVVRCLCLVPGNRLSSPTSVPVTRRTWGRIQIPPEASAYKTWWLYGHGDLRRLFRGLLWTQAGSRQVPEFHARERTAERSEDTSRRGGLETKHTPRAVFSRLSVTLIALRSEALSGERGGPLPPGMRHAPSRQGAAVIGSPSSALEGSSPGKNTVLTRVYKSDIWRPI